MFSSTLDSTMAEMELSETKFSAFNVPNSTMASSTLSPEVAAGEFGETSSTRMKGVGRQIFVPSSWAVTSESLIKLV